MAKGMWERPLADTREAGLGAELRLEIGGWEAAPGTEAKGLLPPRGRKLPVGELTAYRCGRWTWVPAGAVRTRHWEELEAEPFTWSSAIVSNWRD